jgi:hypothetical protein
MTELFSSTNFTFKLALPLNTLYVSCLLHIRISSILNATSLHKDAYFNDLKQRDTSFFYLLFISFTWHFDKFQVICNRDKILTAILTSDSILIWYVKPCVPIISHRRSTSSVRQLGKNVLVQWRPDSSMLVVVVNYWFSYTKVNNVKITVKKGRECWFFWFHAKLKNLPYLGTSPKNAYIYYIKFSARNSFKFLVRLSELKMFKFKVSLRTWKVY